MNKLIYYFLSLTVLLDALNGFFVMYIPGVLENIVPGIRLIFLIYLVFKISKMDKQTFFRICTIIIITLIGLMMQKLVNTSNVLLIISDFIYITKLLYFYTLMEFILILNSRTSKFKLYNNIMLNNSYLMPLLIIVPTILGISRQTYQSSDLGSIGFYISNNSTNVVMILLTAVLTYNIWNVKENKGKNIFFLCLMLYSLWLQASKTSYFLIAMLIIINVIVYLKRYFFKFYFSYKVLLTNYLIIVISFFVAIVFIMYHNELLEYFSLLINDFYKRQYYQLIQHGSIIDYLNSGRFEMLSSIIVYFKYYVGMFGWVIGVGMSHIIENIGKISEMDFFDIFFSTGLIGILITYGKFISMYSKIIKMEKSQKNIFLLMLLFFIFLFSFFAGHVFVDIISVTFVCLVIGLSGVKKEEGTLLE